MTLASPVSPSERSDILDVLRGFALFGVMMDNLFGFTGWGMLTQPMREALPTWPADGVIGLIEVAFIHGKFYSLFSLLFGIGFSIILFRSQQRKANALAVFYRRIFILALFGLVHCLFVWEGDILLLYALIGCLLPLFRNCSDRTLLIWASSLILLPILVDALAVMYHFKIGASLETLALKIDARHGITDENFRRYLFEKENGWEHWRNWQHSGIVWRYQYIIDSNRIPKVLGLFLFGFYAGRKMIYAKLQDYIPLLKWLRRWGFIIGIPFSFAMAWFEIDNKSIPDPKGLFDTVSYALGVVPLSFAYAATIALWWIRKNGNSKWRWLAPMGRMALTNYLMQTVIGVTLYYAAFLGFGGYVGPVIFVPVGIVFYCLQVAYSNAWFKYFNYGPMEWVWRQLTYGKRLKLRKVKR